MTRRFNLYVDRFEGDFAVLLAEGTQFDLPRDLLPAGTVEGDALAISINVDARKSGKSREEIAELQQWLSDNTHGGSIER